MLKSLSGEVDKNSVRIFITCECGNEVEAGNTCPDCGKANPIAKEFVAGMAIALAESQDFVSIP